VTRDPYEARELFEPERAARHDYIEKYRTGFGFHPHPRDHGVVSIEAAAPRKDASWCPGRTL
jgi:hypothetical protein